MAHEESAGVETVGPMTDAGLSYFAEGRLLSRLGNRSYGQQAVHEGGRLMLRELMSGDWPLEGAGEAESMAVVVQRILANAERNGVVVFDETIL
jgi:hypothetical protein